MHIQGLIIFSYTWKSMIPLKTVRLLTVLANFPASIKANTILKDALKRNVALTHQQTAVIDSLLKGQNVLYIDRTGAGKSASYFVSTKILRQDPKNGPTIVVCPLISLMNDQVRICNLIFSDILG